MRSTSLLLTLAGVALASACHSTPPPETPAPAPPPEVALQNTVDTLSAAEWARELALAEQAYADSVERVRLASEAAWLAAGRDAAARSAELQEQLGAMVHFEVGQAQLQAEGRATLDRKVAILSANPSLQFQIAGACDERGSDEYNLALGTRRAAVVRRYLIDKGIDVVRLDQVSLGEESPIDAESSEAAWARNRRAEFAIMSGYLPLAMN